MTRDMTMITGALEKSLINNKQEGMFGDLVNFLLKLVFALQEEEDEEEEKLAQVCLIDFYRNGGGELSPVRMIMNFLQVLIIHVGNLIAHQLGHVYYQKAI